MWKLDSWRHGIAVFALIFLLVNAAFVILSFTLLDPATEQFEISTTDKSVYQNRVEDAEISDNTVYTLEQHFYYLDFTISKLTDNNDPSWSYEIDWQDDIQSGNPWDVDVQLIQATSKGVWFSILREWERNRFDYELVLLAADSGTVQYRHQIDMDTLDLEIASDTYYQLREIEPIITSSMLEQSLFENIYVYVHLNEFSIQSNLTTDNSNGYIIHLPNISDNVIQINVLDISRFLTLTQLYAIVNNFLPELVLVGNNSSDLIYLHLKFDGSSYATREIQTDTTGRLFITEKGMVSIDNNPGVSFHIKNIDTGKSASIDYSGPATLYTFDYYRGGIVGVGHYVPSGRLSQWDAFLITIDQSDGFDTYLTNLTSSERSHEYIYRLHASKSSLVLEGQNELIIYRSIRVGQLPYTVSNGLIISIPVSLLAIPLLLRVIRKSSLSEPDDLQYPKNV